MSRIFVEISEFFDNPIRTGIQRTVRQLIENWPATVPVCYVRYDAPIDGLVSISSRALRLCLESTLPWKELSREARELDKYGHSRSISLKKTDKVLIPELFYRSDRINFYRNSLLLGLFHSYFIVFDFVPWLNPNAHRVSPATANSIMPYLQLMTLARHRAFISSAVRQDFINRIIRSHETIAGPVIELGANALGLEKQSYDSSRRDYTCIGSLDGKKRQDIVYEAFKSLPAFENSGRLRFLGSVPAVHAHYMQPLLHDKTDEVEIIDNPSDEEIRHVLRSTRVTIFISTDEGYGLPAVESLYSGIPVIAHTDLPCFANLPPLGQIRLPVISVESVATALFSLRKDAQVERLWNEAAQLRISSWSDYTNTVSAWIESE